MINYKEYKMRNYDEGSRSGYVEPPVPSAWVKWSRGDAKLASIKKEDPAAFYGGWRSFLQHKERGSDKIIDNPSLPLPVAERVSESGEHSYKVYATNILSIIPLQWRLRYEYREKINAMEPGPDLDRLVAEQVMGWRVHFRNTACYVTPEEENTVITKVLASTDFWRPSKKDARFVL